MKTLLTLLSIYFSLISTAQSNVEVINTSLNSKQEILYRSYKNVLKIVQDEDDHNTYSLIGEDCTISIQGSTYIVTVDRAYNATISIILSTTTDKIDTVKTQRFKVSNLPDASLHINGKLASEISLREATYLEMKHIPEIPLRDEFKILGWMMLIDDVIYTGDNRLLTAEVIDVLQTVEKGTTIQFKVKAVGSDSITREYDKDITVQ